MRFKSPIKFSFGQEIVPIVGLLYAITDNNNNNAHVNGGCPRAQAVNLYLPSRVISCKVVKIIFQYNSVESNGQNKIC